MSTVTLSLFQAWNFSPYARISKYTEVLSTHLCVCTLYAYTGYMQLKKCLISCFCKLIFVSTHYRDNYSDCFFIFFILSACQFLHFFLFNSFSLLVPSLKDKENLFSTKFIFSYTKKLGLFPTDLNKCEHFQFTILYILYISSYCSNFDMFRSQINFINYKK